MANEKSLKESILGASPFLIKVLELILALLSISLLISPYNKVQPSNLKAGFIYSAYSGAILINILIIVCHFLGERIPKKACLIISCFYGIVLLIAGYMVVQEWKNVQTNIYARQFKHHMDMLIGSGVFSILASIAFFSDIGLTIKYA